MAYDFSTAANSMEEFWMPFTPQRWFKKEPRVVVRGDGMYYYDQEDREILDAVGGLWCVNAGHNASRVKEAVTAQLEVLDYASCFQMGHPTAFKAASRLCAAMPDPYSHVFFSNSGSEAVDTALKIALAYHRARGEGTRRVLIGRERAYHGVGFGGISVGGIPYNRAAFGQLLPYVDHLPQTQDLDHNAFAKGQPDYGAHFADELENLIKLHDPMNVAAVILEPVAGSTGVLPPPKGYLERIQEICHKYGVLFILDEVITGFGRMGAISCTEYFNISPDIITTAKGLTNGAVPMGATFFKEDLYKTFMNGPEQVIEMMHGYTYSGHPLACAAAIGTLDTYVDEGIFENAGKMMPVFEEKIHALKGRPGVVDIRNCGILGGVQLEAYSDEDPARNAREVFVEMFRRGILMRYSGTSLVVSPPLILDETHIAHMFDTLGEVLEDKMG